MLATKEGLYTREDFADELEHGGGGAPRYLHAGPGRRARPRVRPGA